MVFASPPHMFTENCVGPSLLVVQHFKPIMAENIQGRVFTTLRHPLILWSAGSAMQKLLTIQGPGRGQENH